MLHSTNQRVQQLEEQIARMFTHITSLEQKCNQGCGELVTDTRQMREEVNAFESQVERGVHHTALQEVTKGMREIEPRLQAQSQLHIREMERRLSERLTRWEQEYVHGSSPHVPSPAPAPPPPQPPSQPPTRPSQPRDRAEMRVTFPKAEPAEKARLQVPPTHLGSYGTEFPPLPPLGHAFEGRQESENVNPSPAPRLTASGKWARIVGTSSSPLV